MAQYMIEVSHDPMPASCERSRDALLLAGAHYLTNAYWGCSSGHHISWLIVDAEDDNEARLLTPPLMRQSAIVCRLEKFTPEEIKAKHLQLG